jgi:hypothetical protein
MKDSKSPMRMARRVLIALAVVVIVAVIAVASLPWVLNTAPARRWLLVQANRVLAPGKLEVDAFHFSWLGPVRMERFVIRDHQGERVVESPQAVWDRQLTQILFDRPRYGTLRLTGGALNVERLEDGTIDLYEALKPVLTPNPKADLLVQVRNATLSVLDKKGQLPHPITAERADIDLHVAAAPKPLTWNVKLVNASGADEQTLAIVGRFARWSETAGAHHDLALNVTTQRWPLELGTKGLEVRGRLDGTAQAIQHEGLWELAGDAQVRKLDAQGSSLRGDRLHWSEASGSWKMQQTADGWSIGALNIRAPVGSLKANGALSATDTTSRIEGELDLAALARQLPHALYLPQDVTIERGSAHVVAEGKGSAWTLDGRVADLAALRGNERITLTKPGRIQGHVQPGQSSGEAQFEGRLELGSTPWNDGPIRMTAQGAYRPQIGELELSDLTLWESRGTLKAHGLIKDLKGRRDTSFAGTLTPDWEKLNTTLSERIEPDAYVRGEPIVFKANGPLSGSLSELWKTWNAELRLELVEADVYGLELERTSIVGRARQGSLFIDPIDATLNGGKVHLEPTLAVDDADQWSISFGKQSAIEGAAINDEVSHRFLAYVVPVMDRATRVRGNVSVDFEKATFPIGKGASRKAVVEGNVVFRNVEFVPGPLAADLLTMLGRPDLPSLKLNQPVVLAIYDGMVHQQGLAIPVGKLTQIELAGTVDFDSNLDLKASLPITPAMFGQNGVLADIVEGTRFDVPIRGTLDAPKIDKEAFRVALGDMGKNLLRKGMARGAAELLFRLAQPRDPEVPPPPRLTPEERRARRIEKREERKARRQQR